MAKIIICHNLTKVIFMTTEIKEPLIINERDYNDTEHEAWIALWEYASASVLYPDGGINIKTFIKYGKEKFEVAIKET